MEILMRTKDQIRIKATNGGNSVWVDVDAMCGNLVVRAFKQHVTHYSESEVSCELIVCQPEEDESF